MEINWQPPLPGEVAPRVARTFVRRGDRLDLVEEEEASKQMEKIQGTLASASSQIQVSQSVLSLVIVDCNLEFVVSTGVDEDNRASRELSGAGYSSHCRK